MPLTGIEIFKLLPKTNCGKCGVPTCLAFAMNLAAGKAQLAACPHVSEEVKTKLSEASAPPILPVTIGVGGPRPVKVGGETVMFRHEKRFESPPGFAMLVSDTMSDAEVDARLERFKLQYERVGLTLRPELIAVKNDSGDVAKFKTLAAKVKEKSEASIILMSEKVDALAAAVAAAADRKPLIWAATKDNVDQVGALAKQNSCAVVAKGANYEELAALTAKLTGMGISGIVLDSGARTLKQSLEDQIVIRSSALAKKFRPLGFPTIVFPCEMTNDPLKEAVFASAFVAKYGAIIVMSDFQGEALFPLLVERLNIYTDPQRPLATTEGIYEINNPNENSPVMITSNFSLTYFIVSGEIEGSKVPSWLLVKDTEGLSVMTAWAAGKFVSDAIAPFVKKCGIADKIKHKKLIIPGYAAAESGGLEEELPGWQILIGPREASLIPAYLKSWKP